MGKATRAAAAVAAPEASAARKLTPGMSRGEVDDELQRRREAAAARKAARAAAPGHPMVPAAAPAAAGPAPTSPGAGPSLPTVTIPAPAQTGSGFLLGVLAWAVGLAYLRGGSDGVKQFFRAKFFNET